MVAGGYGRSRREATSKSQNLTYGEKLLYGPEKITFCSWCLAFGRRNVSSLSTSSKILARIFLREQ